MKRAFDIVFSIAGLALLWPVGLMVAVGVKLSGPGPVLFRQERLGRAGVPFEIFKFRSMRVGGGGPNVTSSNDDRITGFGRFLRRTKLDELPQLMNVLNGQMSFVGPRPEVPEFAELFPREYARILQIRPGITHLGTLRFRREEEILARVRDPRAFYIKRLLPDKIAAYEEELEQGLLQDVRTIVATIIPALAADPYVAKRYLPEPLVLRIPARRPKPAVVVDNPAPPELAPVNLNGNGAATASSHARSRSPAVV